MGHQNRELFDGRRYRVGESLRQQPLNKEVTAVLEEVPEDEFLGLVNHLEVREGHSLNGISLTLIRPAPHIAATGRDIPPRSN